MDFINVYFVFFYFYSVLFPEFPPLFPHSHSDSPHSHSYSPHSYPDSPHSHPDSLHSYHDSLHSMHSLIPFPDSLFQLLQLAIIQEELTWDKWTQLYETNKSIQKIIFWRNNFTQLNSRGLHPYEVPNVFVLSDWSNHALFAWYFNGRKEHISLKKFYLDRTIRYSVCHHSLKP